MPQNTRTLTVPLALALTLLVSGCSSVVVRENIISTINTGVGLSLTENPQTQLYEVRAGYIRSQFYSIPTGKRVDCTACTATNHTSNCTHSNEANTTPEIVSGIRMKSGIEHLLVGMEVSESFAVGGTAVMSDAAIAMYIANARNSKQAASAAVAIGGYDRVIAQRAQILSDKATEVLDHIYGKADTPDREKLSKALKGTALEDQVDAVSTQNRAVFEQRLRGRWRDMIEEMHKNLQQ
jgi:hypothetical protein